MFDLNIWNVEVIFLNGFIRMKLNGDFIGVGCYCKLGIYDVVMCGNWSCEVWFCVCYLWIKSEMYWYNVKGIFDILKEIYLK